MTSATQAIIVAMIAAVPPTLAVLWNIKKTRELHVIVNSRLTELLEVTSKAEHAKGVIEGSSSKGSK